MIKLYKKFFILKSKQQNRIKKNIFSGFSSEVTQIFTQIFFAPLMIYFWGIENFGIWVFLLAIPNVLTVFNVNFNIAAVNEMTIFNSNKKYQKTNEIFQNSIILVYLNILFFLLLFLIYYFFNPLEFSVIKNMTTNEVMVILFLIVISICLNLLGNIFSSVLQSIGKLYIIFRTSNVIDFMMKISIALSGFFFHSLVYPALIFFIFHLIKLIIFFYFFLINKKNIFFSFKYFSFKIIKKLFKLSIGHTAQLTSNIINHSGIIFILGIFYNPYIIGYIATVKTLFYFFPVRFFTKLNHIIYFEVANLFAKKKFILMKKNFFNYLKLIFLLLSVFVATSLFVGPFIYEFWLNNKYELNFTLLVLIILDGFFFVMRHSVMSIFNAINKNFLLGLLEMSLILLAIFTFYFILYFNYSFLIGFSVILFGSIINLIISLIFLVFFFKKITKDN
jgi:O-antigen/teichoic acid export membrane protein